MPYELVKSALGPMVVQSGLHVETEQYGVDEHMSAYIIYACGRTRIRIHWHGFDGAVYLQVYDSHSDEWCNIAPAFLDEYVDDSPDSVAAMKALRGNLVRVLDK